MNYGMILMKYFLGLNILCDVDGCLMENSKSYTLCYNKSIALDYINEYCYPLIIVIIIIISMEADIENNLIF